MVLPAPLGPMSAVMRVALDLDVVDVDGDEAAERPADAVGHQDRVGLGRARLAGDVGERAAPDADPMDASADIEGLLLRVAEDALRPEDDEQDQAEADEHEPDEAEVVLGDEPRRQRPAARVGGVCQEALGERDDEPEDDRRR